jgi:AcrR family transcriptional regulator
MGKKQQTPLAMALGTGARERVTPLDVFHAARRRWLAGQKLHLNEIAEELNVSRATLFRWVGSKDLLLGEILWSVYQPTAEQAKRRAKGKGADYLADVYRQLMVDVLTSKPLRQFVAHDPEYALRVLTTTRPLQERRLASCKALIQKLVARGEMSPALDLDSLAFLIMRLGESFTYSDLIVGREPAVEEACKAIRILAGGKA